jgi:hypothetical protein
VVDAVSPKLQQRLPDKYWDYANYAMTAPEQQQLAENAYPKIIPVANAMAG